MNSANHLGIWEISWQNGTVLEMLHLQSAGKDASFPLSHWGSLG